jgi:hypothetical protein
MDEFDKHIGFILFSDLDIRDYLATFDPYMKYLALHHTICYGIEDTHYVASLLRGEFRSPEFYVCRRNYHEVLSSPKKWEL